MPAIIWGLLSGLSLAFYTLYAIPLLKQFDSLVVVGWGMVLAGVAMSFFHPPWQVDVSSWTATTVIYLIIVIIFGDDAVVLVLHRKLANIDGKGNKFAWQCRTTHCGTGNGYLATRTIWRISVVWDVLYFVYDGLYCVKIGLKMLQHNKMPLLLINRKGAFFYKVKVKNTNKDCYTQSLYTILLLGLRMFSHDD